MDINQSIIIKETEQKCSICYNTFGTNITLIEAMPNILPNEDLDISKELSSILSKRKVNIITNKLVSKVTKTKKTVKLIVDKNEIKTDMVLVAVGEAIKFYIFFLQKIILLVLQT